MPRRENTRTWSPAEAGDIQTKALAKGNYSAAVSALTVKAKLSGHWVDRGEVQTTKVIKTISPVPLTVEEWAAKYGAEVVS
jgi:hypothetical protein